MLSHMVESIVILYLLLQLRLFLVETQLCELLLEALGVAEDQLELFLFMMELLANCTKIVRSNALILQEREYLKLLESHCMLCQHLSREVEEHENLINDLDDFSLY